MSLPAPSSRSSTSAAQEAHPPQAPAWHALSAADCLARLDVQLSEGLSAAEAGARSARDGPNVLPQAARNGPLKRFLLQFHNVLLYVLLGAGAITLLVGHELDAAVIFGVVLINATIGFVQEGKAERALDAIRELLSPRAQVLRDAHRQEIDACELVVGDVVFLSPGDKVPADLRLVDARGLCVDEAVLTGESLAVEKSTEPVAADASIGDRLAMAYCGTLVSAGQGTGVVVATGAQTEIGRISALISAVEVLSTPLLRQMAGFSAMLTWVILAVAVAAFAFGTLVQGQAPGEMFLVAVGLAVAAIPEGLPAVMTITLAIGVQRMARRSAIIRRLPAVEALGSVTVICSDKTGTLTRNEMTVQRVISADGVLEVSGGGYVPEGVFRSAERELEPAATPLLLALGRVCVLCNDAELTLEDKGWVLLGDPTEGALLSLALKAGVDPLRQRAQMVRDDVIPFEAEHRIMATLHHDARGDAHIMLKGAPERVLALCTRCMGLDGGERELDAEHWQQAISAAAAQGMRLLAVAERCAGSGLAALSVDEVNEGGFVLLAVLGITDPPRAEAVRAVERCLGAGIRVKMITGDHVATARAIGQQIGLAAEVKALTGAEIETMSDAGLRSVVLETEIFARASPQHKLRLVEALQAEGEVVAMTGDGVNDAPALKRADVGVAMGCKGTEAAKEAAEMVLADDNFASVAAAVEEGRTVYDNLKKAVVYILPTSIGQAGIVSAALLLGVTMPITPAQILWVNMITAVTLALALAFEAAEPDIMQRRPRDPREPLLTRFLMWRTVFVGALLVAGGMGLFLWELEHGASIPVARSVAVNAVLIGEVFYLFNMRSLTGSVLKPAGFLGNRYVLWAIGVLLVCQAAFTYLPVLQTLFGSAAISPAAWLRILGFGVALLLLVEAEKAFVRRNIEPSRNGGA